MTIDLNPQGYDPQGYDHNLPDLVIGQIGPLNAAPFNIKTELERAIKSTRDYPQQVDLIRLYIETYGAIPHP